MRSSDALPAAGFDIKSRLLSNYSVVDSSANCIFFFSFSFSLIFRSVSIFYSVVKYILYYLIRRVVIAYFEIILSYLRVYFISRKYGTMVRRAIPWIGLAGGSIVADNNEKGKCTKPGRMECGHRRCKHADWRSEWLGSPQSLEGAKIFCWLTLEYLHGLRIWCFGRIYWCRIVPYREGEREQQCSPGDYNWVLVPAGFDWIRPDRNQSKQLKPVKASRNHSKPAEATQSRQKPIEAEQRPILSYSPLVFTVRPFSRHLLAFSFRLRNVFCSSKFIN